MLQKGQLGIERTTYYRLSGAETKSKRSAKYINCFYKLQESILQCSSLLAGPGSPDVKYSPNDNCVPLQNAALLAY